MRAGKIGLLLLSGVMALAGCASRLGYPAKTVGIPTPVTLFSHIAANTTLKVTMPYLARDMWSALYEKRFNDVLGGVSRERLLRQLNLAFSRDVGKSTDLFTPSSAEVTDLGAELWIAKSDPPGYSGFNFSAIKDTIPTQYVLALTIDEWGHIAAQADRDTGPFIALTIQLVDKDTNLAAWKYHYVFQQQVDKAANELTTTPHMLDLFEHLIPQSVDQYFNWLGW